MDVVLGADNRFAAAYTNNNQTILLNTMISEFVIIDNPLGEGESVEGLVLMENLLVIYGALTWCTYTTTGKLLETKKLPFYKDGSYPILTMFLSTLTQSVAATANVALARRGAQADKGDKPGLEYFVIRWSGDLDNTKMVLETLSEKNWAQKGLYTLECHGGLVLNAKKNKVWTCPDTQSNNVAMFALKNKCWVKQKEYCDNSHALIQLALSGDEGYLIGTFTDGFQLWKATGADQGETLVTLKLPNNVRNVPIKMNKSNGCVLSAGNNYAVSGVRKVLYLFI